MLLLLQTSACLVGLAEVSLDCDILNLLYNLQHFLKLDQLQNIIQNYSKLRLVANLAIASRDALSITFITLRYYSQVIDQSQVSNIRYSMFGPVPSFSDNLQGWNSQDEEPASNNMLRILENKIIHSSRQHRGLKKITPTCHKQSRSPLVRPATVRIRPTSQYSQRRDQVLEGSNTVELYDELLKNRNKKQGNSCAMGQKSCNEIRRRGNTSVNSSRQQTHNKQNQYDREYSSMALKGNEQQPKKQQVNVKKQSLIFSNYTGAKSKNMSKNISKFHEMEIKLRKNKMRSSCGMGRRLQIFIEKTCEIKIHVANPIGDRKEEMHPGVGRDRGFETTYTKLSRRNKFSLRDRKQGDLFTDAHLSEQSGPKLLD